jgi:phosphate transport system permease protein
MRMVYRSIVDRTIAALSLGAAFFSAGLLIIIIGILFIGALPVLSPYFILTPEIAAHAYDGAIGNAVAGTILITVLATLIAVPFALGTAIYLAKYAPNNRYTATIRFFIEVLSGTPSIVVGVFGFLLLVVYLKPFSGGYSLIAGSIGLGILIMPVIERSAEEAIRSISAELEEGSYALGATKWQTLRQVTIPAATSGILTGIILGFGRSAEESAVVMFTAGYSQFMPEFTIRSNPNMFLGMKIYPLQDLVATLPVSVYNAYEHANIVPPANGFATAFILIVVVLAINLAAKIVCSGMLADAQGRKSDSPSLNGRITRFWNMLPVMMKSRGDHGKHGKEKALCIQKDVPNRIVPLTNRTKTEFVHPKLVPARIETFEPLFEGEPQSTISPADPESLDPQIGFIDKIIEDMETEIKNNPSSAHKSIITPIKPEFIEPPRSIATLSGDPVTNRNGEPAQVARSVVLPAKPASANSPRSVVKIIVDLETDQKNVPASVSRSVIQPSKSGSTYPRCRSVTRITEHPVTDRKGEPAPVDQPEIAGMKISGPQPEIADSDESISHEEMTAREAADPQPEGIDAKISGSKPEISKKKLPLNSQIRPFLRTLFPFTIPAAILLLIAAFSNVSPIYHALGPVSQSLAGLFAMGLSFLVMVIGIVFALSFAKKSGAFKAPARQTAFNSIAVGFCLVVIAGIVCSSAASGIFKTNAGPAATDDRAAKLAAMLAAGDPPGDSSAVSGSQVLPTLVPTPGNATGITIPVKDALSLGEIYQYGDSHHHIKVTVYDEKVLPYYFWWWIDYNRFVQSMPASGNSYLVVFLHVENTGDQSAVIPTADSFTVGYNGKTYSRLPYMNTSVISAFQANSLRDPVKREQYYQWIREIGESKRDYAYLTGQTYFADSWLDNSTDLQNSTSVNLSSGNYTSGNSTAYSWYYLKPGVSQAVDGYLVYEVPDAVATHLSTTYLNAVFNQISATRWKLG